MFDEAPSATQVVHVPGGGSRGRRRKVTARETCQTRRLGHQRADRRSVIALALPGGRIGSESCELGGGR